MFHKLAVFLATGFGLGLAPVASGTFGTLPGILIALALNAQSWRIQAAASALMILTAIPICGAAEKVFKKKDDGRIVADEYLTFPLVVIGIPITGAFWPMIPIAFVVHRVMDILKPSPARESQKLGGGLGIVIDDAISGLYALAINHAIFQALKWGGMWPA